LPLINISVSNMPEKSATKWNDTVTSIASSQRYTI